MAEFNLKEFTVQDRGWWNNPHNDWRGGGHTIETDPVRQGWKAARAAPGSDTVIIGRKGVKGCISARLLTGKIDIALYTNETPEEVAKAGNERHLFDPIYVGTQVYPGWGLAALAELQRIMAREQ
jgi:hypothetical protein